MHAATAEAHPNIALVKYWGKRDGPGNVPATPSLSITLDALTTRTRVSFEPTTRKRTVVLNGAAVHDAKIDACIDRLLARGGRRLPPIRVETDNNFPTAAGLASSASGFAALVTALDGALELGLSDAERCDEARRASASAARSLYEGFVALTGGDDPESWQARPLLAADAWPLEVVVAICAESAKATSSGAGMLQSRSSPFYRSWLAQAPNDFETAQRAIAARDFAALAEVAEANCLAMHAVMLSARPGLVYWNGATVECIHCVRALRAAGTDVFFTIDAGPQIKAVCSSAAVTTVHDALLSIAGAERVLTAGIGGAARLLSQSSP
jgi:diphosphomevalonate decarboxylase